MSGSGIALTHPLAYDGSVHAAHGALIPEGYKLSAATPTHPWICAIRSCRKVFAQIGQLGRHFNVIDCHKRPPFALTNPDSGAIVVRGCTTTKTVHSPSVASPARRAQAQASDSPLSSSPGAPPTRPIQQHSHRPTPGLCQPRTTTPRTSTPRTPSSPNSART